MTILITGGAGYIGSHVLLALRDAGRFGVALDDLSSGRRSAVPAGAPFYEGDCGDAALLTRIMRRHQIRSVLHFAGSIWVGESISDPLGYYLNNTARSRTLIEAAVREGVEAFIFSSTAAVYGATAESPIPETAPLAPVSPYGASKLMTETMLRDVERAHGLRHVILRYFNVAGADPALRSGEVTRNSRHLVKLACEAALGFRTGLEIFGGDYPTPDGTAVRDYVHVNDLAAAHLLALERLERGGTSLTCNCGYGQGVSVREVIAGVQQEAGRTFSVRLKPRRPGDPARLVAQATKARDALGWRPRFDDLATIARHALAWERRDRGFAERGPTNLHAKAGGNAAAVAPPSLPQGRP